MKKFIRTISLLFLAIFFAVSCETENNDIEQEITTQAIPERIITKLKKAGFYTEYGLSKHKNGYIVETDIFLTEVQIDELLKDIEPGTETINSKQYRTNNLVDINGGSRTLNVFFDPSFDRYMQNSFDTALRRYNVLDLRLKFKRTKNRNTNDIRILLGDFSNPNTLGRSAGFPSGGNPAKTITLNRSFFDSGTNQRDAITVITHEIGHAIGFRHTDFKNRAFSCGGRFNNEGSTVYGANHIPGTPLGPDPNSWMLACSNNTDRPFTPADKTALFVLYGKIKLDRTKGEIRAHPGTQIDLSYRGSIGTICSTRQESLFFSISGGPNIIYDDLSWATYSPYSNLSTVDSGSMVFTMPASGVVKINASLTTVGCSTASITINGDQRISLGYGFGGKTKFP